MRLIDERGVEVDALFLHHARHPGLALHRRHGPELGGHRGLIDAGVLGAQVHHVIAERLVGHDANMRVRILVRRDALRLGRTRLNVGLELAGLQQAQSLSVELPLDDAGHHHDGAFHLAKASQVRVRTQHDVRFPAAGTSSQHNALIRRCQLHGALLGHVLAGHRDAPNLRGLAGFEVGPHVAHHGRDLPFCGMPQGVPLIGPQ